MKCSEYCLRRILVMCSLAESTGMKIYENQFETTKEVWLNWSYGIPKFGHSFDAQNIRCLMNNLVILEERLELMLPQPIATDCYQSGQQGKLTEGEGSVQLISSLRSLFCNKMKQYFNIKNNWSKLVSKRRLMVLSLPPHQGFLALMRVLSF